MSRNITVDVLKLILAFMVVGQHTNFLSDVTLLGNYLTVNGIFRIAVPIFLLISGFYFYPVLLQGKAITWFKRVALLYLFWLLFYSYLWLDFSEFSVGELAKITQQVFIGPLHLWFLPGMLGAAFLVMLLKKMPSKFMLLTILVTFFIGVVIQYLGNYHVIANPEIDEYFNEFWAHRNFLFFAFPFFGLGFLINKLNVHKSLSLKATVALSFIGLLLLVAESYINFFAPKREGGFDNFAALLLVCPAVFIMATQLTFQGKSKELALYSTGIYFIHISIIYFYMQTSGFSATASTFVVFGLSVIVSFFLIQLHKRIKFIL